ncbi:MAG: VCBS repeat-containing protein, partial [Gemmatimonadales bacterium]
MTLLVGCAAPTTTAGGGLSAQTVASSYQRVVDDFDVRTEAGERYAHPFLGGLNVPRPQLVDIDGDGDLDLFVQERGGEIMFFEQVGSSAEPRYRWRTDAFHDLNVGEWYRFADIDADGDLDLLGEKRFSYISYWRNEGSPQAASFVLAADTLRDISGTPLFSDRQNIPNVSDLDCDGKLDLFIGRLVGTISRYEAEGVDENDVPRFRHITDRFEDIEIVANLMGSLHGANTLAMADIDRDGDLDLFWGDFFEQGLLFIENSGSCASPRLNADPVQVPVGNPVLTSGYNAMAFGDVDGDQNLDLVIGVLGGAFNPNLTTADNLY